MRGSVVLVALLAVTAQAEPGPTRWQQATNPPPISRVWGIAGTLYGASTAGAYRSTDNGATWSLVSEGAATGVWGSSQTDLWLVRAKTIHHSATGVHWTTQQLPMLSYAARLEGMWGVDRERYLFGADRTGAILHSRDGGASWRAETLPVEVARISSVWGSAANDVYAVGARGVILHSHGDGQWRVVRAPTTGSLEGIWGTSATSIYAVGTNGAILFGDGKTWTPRPSGVTYTLSSIVGFGNELYASSIDGAPLRSTDGRSWKPLTAIVRRGHVWPEGDRLVVANASEVHFLGETNMVAAPPAMPVVAAPLTQSIVVPTLTSKADASSFHRQIKSSSFPHTGDLLELAAIRFGSSLPYDHRLDSVGPAVARFERISNCMGLGDDSTPRTGRGVEIEIKLACTLTCSEVSAKWSARITRDGKLVRLLNSGARVTITSCAYQLAEVANLLRVVIDHVIDQHEKRLSDELLNTLVLVGPTPDAQLDAYARYVLFGGKDVKAKLEIARLLGQSDRWPGFFWNSPVAFAPPLPGTTP